EFSYSTTIWREGEIYEEGTIDGQTAYFPKTKKLNNSGGQAGIWSLDDYKFYITSNYLSGTSMGMRDGISYRVVVYTDKHTYIGDRIFQFKDNTNPEIKTQTLPKVRIGEPYSAKLTGEAKMGGTLSWEVVDRQWGKNKEGEEINWKAQLPKGLTLSKDGTISGTYAPDESDTKEYNQKWYFLKFKVSESSGGSNQKEITLYVDQSIRFDIQNLTEGEKARLLFDKNDDSQPLELGKVGEGENFIIPPNSVKEAMYEGKGKFCLERDTAFGPARDGEVSAQRKMSYTLKASDCELYEVKTELSEKTAILLYQQDGSLLNGNEEGYRILKGQDDSVLKGITAKYSGRGDYESFAIEDGLTVSVDKAARAFNVSAKKREFGAFLKGSVVCFSTRYLEEENGKTYEAEDILVTVTQQLPEHAGQITSSAKTDVYGKFTVENLAKGVLETSVTFSSPDYLKKEVVLGSFNSSQKLEDAGKGGRQMKETVNVGVYQGTGDVIVLVKGMDVLAEKSSVGAVNEDGSITIKKTKYWMAEMLSPRFSINQLYNSRDLGLVYAEETGEGINYYTEEEAKEKGKTSLPRYEAYVVQGIPENLLTNGRQMQIYGLPKEEGYTYTVSLKVKGEDQVPQPVMLSLDQDYCMVDYSDVAAPSTVHSYFSVLDNKGKVKQLYGNGSGNAILAAPGSGESYTAYYANSTVGKVTAHTDSEKVFKQKLTFTNNACMLSGEVPTDNTRGYASLFYPASAASGENLRVKGMLYPGKEGLSRLRIAGQDLLQVVINGEQQKIGVISSGSLYEVVLEKALSSGEAASISMAFRMSSSGGYTLYDQNNAALAQFYINQSSSLTLEAPLRVYADEEGDALVHFHGDAKFGSSYRRYVYLYDNGIPVGKAEILISSGELGHYNGTLHLASQERSHELLASYLSPEEMTESLSSPEEGEYARATIIRSNGDTVLNDITMTWQGITGGGSVTLHPGDEELTYVVRGGMGAVYSAEIKNVAADSAGNLIGLTKFAQTTEEDYATFEDMLENPAGYNAPPELPEYYAYFRIRTAGGIYVVPAKHIEYYGATNTAWLSSDQVQQGTDYTIGIQVVYLPADESELMSQDVQRRLKEAVYTTDAAGNPVLDEEKSRYEEASYDVVEIQDSVTEYEAVPEEVKELRVLEGFDAETESLLQTNAGLVKDYVNQGYTEEQAKEAVIASAELTEAGEQTFAAMEAAIPQNAGALYYNYSPSTRFYDYSGDLQASAWESGDFSASEAASGAEKTIREIIEERNQDLLGNLELTRMGISENPSLANDVVKMGQVDADSARDKAAETGHKNGVTATVYTDYTYAVNEAMMSHMGYQKSVYEYWNKNQNKEVDPPLTMRMYYATTYYEKNGQIIADTARQNDDDASAKLETYIYLNPEVPAGNPFRWTRIQIAFMAEGANNPIYTNGFVAPLATWTPTSYTHLGTPVTDIPKSAPAAALKAGEDDGRAFEGSLGAGNSFKTTIEPSNKAKSFFGTGFTFQIVPEKAEDLSISTYLSALSVGISYFSAIKTAAQACKAARTAEEGSKAVKNFKEMVKQLTLWEKEEGIVISKKLVTLEGPTEEFTKKYFTADGTKLISITEKETKYATVELVKRLKIDFNLISLDTETVTSSVLAIGSMATDKKGASATLESEFKDDEKYYKDCLHYLTKAVDEDDAFWGSAPNLAHSYKDKLVQQMKDLNDLEEELDLTRNQSEFANGWGLKTYDYISLATGLIPNPWTIGTSLVTGTTSLVFSAANDNRVSQLTRKYLEYAIKKAKLKEELAQVGVPPEEKKAGSSGKDDEDEDDGKDDGTDDGQGGGKDDGKDDGQGGGKDDGTDDGQGGGKDDGQGGGNGGTPKPPGKDEDDNTSITTGGKKNPDPKKSNGGRPSATSGRDDVTATPTADPSGIVYEAVLSNPVSGAEVTIYTNDAGSKWRPEYENGIAEGIPSNTSSAGSLANKVSPDIRKIDPKSHTLFTDENGYYSWNVAEGLWYVEAKKSGYNAPDGTEISSSNQDVNATVKGADYNWLPVLPEQLAVNIPLVDESVPQVKEFQAQNDRAYLTFSKYMTVEGLGISREQALSAGKAYLDSVKEEDSEETAEELYFFEIGSGETDASGNNILSKYYTVTDGNGKAIPYSLRILDAEQAPANIDYGGPAPWYATKVRLRFNEALSEGSGVTIRLLAQEGDGHFTSYAGTQMEVEELPEGDSVVYQNAEDSVQRSEAQAPVFSLAEGFVKASESLVLTSETSDSMIYYTTNGKSPVSGGTISDSAILYTGAISLASFAGSSVTIRAAAKKEGYEISDVVSKTYRVGESWQEEESQPLEKPVITPSSGTIAKGSRIQISSANSGATLYYYTSLDPESRVYEGAFPIEEDMVVYAYALKEGYRGSKVSMAVYTIAETPDDAAEAVPVKSIKISALDPETYVPLTQKSFALGIGKTMMLTAVSVLPENTKQKLDWRIKDSTVAAFVDGAGLSPDLNNAKTVTLQGLKAGTAVITATGQGGKSVSIKVKIGEPVSQIELTGKEIVPVGKTLALKARFNEGKSKPANQNLIWESDDETIATVSAKGVVTGLREGSVTISARSASDGVVSEGRTVQVYVPIKSVKLNQTNVILSLAGAKAFPLKAQITPALTYGNLNGTATGLKAGSYANPTSPEVSWALKNAEDGTYVALSADGTLQGKAATKKAVQVVCTVEALNYKKSFTCKVSVKESAPAKGLKLAQSKINLVAGGDSKSVEAFLNPAVPDAPGIRVSGYQDVGTKQLAESSEIVTARVSGNEILLRPGTKTGTTKVFIETVDKNQKTGKPVKTV
ncbi:MAG: chitobiase/beta-hexosaminidase C-terminal domain-containing protein, partial [Lachnospiraceae bacterium]|nr:chitobiase/beta-hexosaminidase C-terminal domain-containing protein [Lachnospiraceae bacterium]